MTAAPSATDAFVALSADEFNRQMQAAQTIAEAALLQKLADQYAAALRSVAPDVARRFAQKATALRAAVGDEQVDAKFVPPDPGELVPRAALAAEIEKRTQKIREQAVQVQIGPTLHSVGVSFEPGGVFEQQILEKVGARIRDADLSTRDAIRTVIDQAQAEGWTVPETAAAIKAHITELSDSTAIQLARTDLIGTANASSIAAARMVFAGQDVNKRWLATPDDRTRPTHREANGQTVPMDQPFNVGGDLLDYPGDPDGSDGEVCNCRCTVLFEPVGQPAQGRHWEDAMAHLDELTLDDVKAGNVPGIRFDAAAFDSKRNLPGVIRGETMLLGPAAFMEGGAADVGGILGVSAAKIARALFAEGLGLPEELLPVKIEQTGVALGFEKPSVVVDPDAYVVKGYVHLLSEPPGKQESTTDKIRIALLDKIAAVAKKLGLPSTRIYKRKGDVLVALDDAQRAVSRAARLKAKDTLSEAEDAVAKVAVVDPDVATRLVLNALAAAFNPALHPHEPGGSPVGGRWASTTAVAPGANLDEVLSNMGAYDLEGGQDRHPERYMKHPKSGFNVEKPGVVYQEATAPVLDADGWGRQPPRIRDVVNGEGFGLPPGYTAADVESGKITSLGYGKYQIGEPRPPEYLYRAVSEGEWQQAKARGFLQSDQRMNLSNTEGTVTALSNPSFYLPGNLASDKPGTYEGRILRIKYRDEDGWRHDRDDYVKTSQPVPVSQVDMISPKLVRETTVDARGNVNAGPWAVTRTP